MKKYDASIRRRMYWSNEIQLSRVCPECGGPLEKEYHIYVLLVKERKDVIPFMAGNDGGRFCSKCPVVVLDNEVFARGAVAGGASEFRKFTVAGIVDIEAIPEDKKNIPLGEEDNPIPLVEFIQTKDGSKKAEPVRGKKIGRNEPCPCGSGKKYKKCCWEK